MLRRVRNKQLRGLQVRDLQLVAAYLMGLQVGIVNLDGFPICQVGNRGEGELSMDMIFVFVGLSMLSSLHCKNLSKEMIKEVGIVMRYYPKRYIRPKRWIRRLFNIHQQMIPRYLYIELFVSIIYASLGPIYLILAVCFGTKVAAALVLSHMCFVLINTSYIIVRTSIFKRGR